MVRRTLRQWESKAKQPKSCASGLHLAILATIPALVFSPVWADAEQRPAEILSPRPTDKVRNAEEELRKFVGETCDTIEAEATANELPSGFLARLIWTESRFNPKAQSPKGAQGIAQFMPDTARERGLDDPFDSATSLAASAAYLRDLRASFGNLGLAAAAYNAGPARIDRWRSGTASLPGETRNFVFTITGMTAQEWAENDAAEPDFALHAEKPFSEACRSFASLAKAVPSSPADPASKPWGALIATSFSKDGAEAMLTRLAAEHDIIAAYETVEILRRPNPHRGGKLMYRVTLGADNLPDARDLCADLRHYDVACMAVRN
jgi:Transglycosylase SLT domain